MSLTSEAIKTEALIKFVIEHKHDNERCISLLRACAVALHAGNAEEAIEHYDEFSSSCGIGRMGCFDDGGISIAYEHEDINYIYAIFGALLSQWSLSMRLLKQSTSNKKINRTKKNQRLF